MKNILRAASLALAVLLLLSVFPYASAEEADEQTRKKDRSRIQYAISVTAAMVGSALDQLDSAEDVALRGQLQAFSEVRYLHPDKAVVVELTTFQMNNAIRALKKNDWLDIVPTLAEHFNSQFSETYAQAAQLVQSEGRSSDERKGACSLVLLPYGGHIAAVAMSPSSEIRRRGTFIVSTEEISQSLDEAEIRKYCGQFGAEDAAVRVYEEAALKQDDWIVKSSWPISPMSAAIGASGTRLRAMLPALVRDELSYMNNTDKYRVVIDLLRPDNVRFIAETCLPVLNKDAEDPAVYLLKQSDEAYKRSEPAPEPEYGGELREAELKPDGTYLAVIVRAVPDQEPVSWYDVVLEAALPPANIPENPEDADYIIRCYTTFDGGVKNGKAHLHYPVTRITVHDAHTGEMLWDLGQVKRTLHGVIMLAPGDTWWSPLRTMLWEKIGPLFAEK